MTDFKNQAKRLRTALAEEGIAVSHARALELVARVHGAHDWNTLAARPGTSAPQTPAAFALGQPVSGTFYGKPAKGHVVGLEQTIKPELVRLTVAFDPPVDASTSAHFKAERRRVTMIVGRDGRSRRLTGTETGHMALRPD